MSVVPTSSGSLPGSERLRFTNSYESKIEPCRPSRAICLQISSVSDKAFHELFDHLGSFKNSSSYANLNNVRVQISRERRTASANEHEHDDEEEYPGKAGLSSG